MQDTEQTDYAGALSDADYRLQADFRCALRQFLHFAENRAREVGLTPQQHLLLLVVRGHVSYPAVSIADIARSLQIRPHSASLLVDRAVKRGLLTRTFSAEDHRRAEISLSDRGTNLLEGITLANRQELGRHEELLLMFLQFLTRHRDDVLAATRR